MNPQFSGYVVVVARYIVSHTPPERKETYRSSWGGSWAHGVSERSSSNLASLPVSVSSKYIRNQVGTYESNGILLRPKCHSCSLHVIGRTGPSHQWVLPSS